MGAGADWCMCKGEPEEEDMGPMDGERLPSCRCRGDIGEGGGSIEGEAGTSMLSSRWARA